MVVKPWHRTVSRLLEVGEVLLASKVLQEAENSSCELGFDSQSYLDVTFRLRIDIALLQVERVRACAGYIERLNVPPKGSWESECLLLSYFMLGTYFRDEEDGLRYFKQSIEIDPYFSPSQIELAAIDRGLKIEALFAELGFDLPRLEWKYRLAAASMGITIGSSKSLPKSCAICIRGIVLPETISIIRILKSLSPGVPVFLSTWSNLSEDLRGVLAEDCTLILEDDVEYPGPSNVNRQIALAKSCLRSAQKSGAETVLLMRTDVAIFKENIISSMQNVLSRYPSAPGMSGRLIIPEIYTRKYHLFHPSDMFMFGYADDVARFWFQKPCTPTDTPLPPEMYLSTQFISGITGRPVDWNKDASLAYLRDYFVVESMDFFESVWTKRPALKDLDELYFIDKIIDGDAWRNLYFSDSIEEACGFNGLSRGAVSEAVLGIKAF